MILNRPDGNLSAKDTEAFRWASVKGRTDIVRLLEQDDRVKAINFLNENQVPLTETTFLKLFALPFPPSYIKCVFAERPNHLVASFMADIPLDIYLPNAR